MTTYQITAIDSGPYIGSAHSMRTTHHRTVVAPDPSSAIERLHDALERELGILGVMNTAWSYTVQTGGESSEYCVVGSAGRGYRPELLT